MPSFRLIADPPLIAETYRVERSLTGPSFLALLIKLVAVVLLLAILGYAAAAGLYIAVAVSLLLLFAMLFSGTLSTWRHIAKLKRAGEFGKESIVRLNGDGVVTYESDQERRLPWSSFTMAKRLKTGYLLVREHEALWLPDRTMVSGTHSEMAALLEKANAT